MTVSKSLFVRFTEVDAVKELLSLFVSPDVSHNNSNEATTKEALATLTSYQLTIWVADTEVVVIEGVEYRFYRGKDSTKIFMVSSEDNQYGTKSVCYYDVSDYVSQKDFRVYVEGML